MVHIYYTVFESTIPESRWAYLVKQMPPNIQQRLLRYRKSENKYQLLLGRLLLKKILFNLGYSDFQLADVQYSDHQKPFWKDTIDFSIAHSGHVVVCAVSTEGVIGIDVERIQQLPIKDFAHILNEKDYQLLATSKHKMTTFFKLWTIKEAVSKADGRGLSMDVQRIYLEGQEALFGTQRWQYKTLDLKEGFQCHYVVPQEKRLTAVVKEIRIEKVL